MPSRPAPSKSPPEGETLFAALPSWEGWMGLVVLLFINKFSACRKNLLQKMQIQRTIAFFLLIIHTTPKAANKNKA
jgi:hypothetical protein